MFKFLRKYNKFILAVGGTLLLIVFLIPQALTRLSEQAAQTSATWATVGPDAREISVTERQESQGELEFMQSSPLLAVLPTVLGIETPEHWWLIVHEARQMGLVPGAGSIAISDFDRAVLPPQFSPAFVRQALAKAEGVENLLRQYEASGTLSDRRLLEAVQRNLLQVQADLIVLEASADRVAVMPAEEEIQTHFDTYADVVPGEGEMGFGYRLPDRFKIEMLTISNRSVETMIEASDRINEVELRKYWRKNEGIGGTPLVSEGDPVPAIVRQNMILELTRKTLDDIERWAFDRLREPRRKLDEQDGYYVLPEEWDQQRVSFTSLAEEIRDRFDIDLPVYESIGDRWLSADDLPELGPIANARTDRYGTANQALADLVAATREFGGSPTVPIQSGVALPPLRGLARTVHLARLTAVDAERAPTSVDEVREMIVTDLKRQRDYERMMSEMESIEQQAEQDGMLAVAIDRQAPVADTSLSLYNPTLVQLQIQQGQPITPFATPLPIIGEAIDVLEQVFDYAIDLPFGQALDELPVSRRIVSIPVEKKLAAVLLRITDVRPVTTETYRQLAQSGRLGQFVRGNDLTEDDITVLDAFSYDSLVARHSFVVAGRDDEEVDPETEADSETETGGAVGATAAAGN